jgi:hypothetical protein
MPAAVRQMTAAMSGQHPAIVGAEMRVSVPLMMNPDAISQIHWLLDEIAQQTESKGF